jgi:transaldolase
MVELNYLEWLARETPTAWWQDSGEPGELQRAKEWGALGVTTNPVLAYTALRNHPELRSGGAAEAGSSAQAQERAEEMLSRLIANAAAVFEPIYHETKRRQGYVCAQVNPALSGQKDAMLAMAARIGSWAPNVSVKLPATAAGIAALEECAARGICVTSTASFTVAQVIAAAEAYGRGKSRAERSGIEPAPCFAVIMIGRIDDYLREVVVDNGLDVREEDIRQAGLAVVKRALGIFRERGYGTRLLIAALRGPHHMVGLCGGDLVMSIHPSVQKSLFAPGVPRTMGIASAIPKDSLARLLSVGEFRKAYEVGGLAERDFIAYGLTQKTLSQFVSGGWSLLESLA